MKDKEVSIKAKEWKRNFRGTGIREGEGGCYHRDLPVTVTGVSRADSISPEQIKSDETSFTATDKERGSKLPPKLKEMER